MPKVYLHTSLSRLTQKQIVDIGNATLRWVKKMYPYYSKYVKLKVSQYKKYRCWGDYDFTTKYITVYFKNITKVIDYIETILHEFKHSSQSHHRYFQLAEKYSYSKHPYEISANKFCKKQSNRCWRNIQHKCCL